MKIYLDDIRNPPDDTWVVCRTAEEAINLLWVYKVHEISLDHDLGKDRKTGYDVICEIEEMCFDDPNYIVPIIHIHTANPVGRTKMQSALDNITEWTETTSNDF